jgi:hypothetical protein
VEGVSQRAEQGRPGSLWSPLRPGQIPYRCRSLHGASMALRNYSYFHLPGTRKNAWGYSGGIQKREGKQDLLETIARTVHAAKHLFAITPPRECEFWLVVLTYTLADRGCQRKYWSDSPLHFPPFRSVSRDRARRKTSRPQCAVSTSFV